MNGWQIALVAWTAFGGIITVAMIGKPRRATTPGQAVIQLIICAALIAMVVKAR
jgi:hypothetical protein